jgi:hypothetical protein
MPAFAARSAARSFGHTACGNEIHQQIRCAACEEQIRQTDIKARPGPGLLPPDDHPQHTHEASESGQSLASQR